MKKRLSIILLLALIAAICLVLTACNHEHSFGDWQVETAATCTADGVEARTCSCGEKETRPISATGHDYTSEVKQPTCTQEGGTVHTCGKCGHTYTDNIVPTIAHNYMAQSQQPTCTEAGYLAYVCTVCGDVESNEVIPERGHVYLSSVTEPSCESGGYTTHTCIVCGDTYTSNIIDKFSHNFVAPNFTCEHCGAPCSHDKKDSADCSCLVCNAVEHTWENGVCTLCQKKCAHPQWTDNTCDSCGTHCQHSGYTYGVCNDCGTFISAEARQSCNHSFVMSFCKYCLAQYEDMAATSNTYNISTNLIDTNWNILSIYDYSQNEVLSYTQDSLYTYDYNENKTGYQFVPAMALSMPVEVPLTAELAQKWGFEADEDGNYPQHHIWKIPLRTDLKFDNGDPITAQTYVQTLHRLLNKDANYNNVHNLYASLVVIKNIEKYLRQNQDIVHSASNLYTSWDDATNAHADDLVFSIENSYIGNWLYSLYGIGYINQYDGYNGLYSTVVGVDRELLDALTGKTWTEISADAELTSKWKTVLASWNPAPNEELHFFIVEDKTEAITLEQVGIYAENDHTLVLVLDKPLDSLVLVSQLKLPLVHIETYDSCTKVENGVFTTTYGTSVDTYVGYGPYKLTVYEEGTVLQFTRNQHWYNNPKNIVGGSPYYQATGIVIRQITNPELAFQMFLRGELDKLDLDPYNVEENYGNPNVYYQDEASTWFLTMSPNEEALQFRQENTSPVNEGYVVNKTVITIKEFRQALSYSLDRLQYILALGYEAIPQVGILGPATVADQYSGEIYRLTEQGKDNLLAYWGLTNQVCTDSCTEGCTTHKFATKDDALDSITGYDLEQAKQLFDKAYDIAVEKQLIPADALASGKWEVKLTIAFSRGIHYPESTQSFNQLVSIWKQAVKGTKFEGHLEFSQCPPLGLSYRDYLRNNEIDILLDYGWSSYLLYPIASLDLFIDPQFKYENIWDTTTEQLEIELPLNAQGQYDPNGTPAVVSGTVYDWRCLLTGEQKTFTVLDGTDQPTTITLSASDPQHSAMRITILSCLENAILQQYNVIKICGTVNAHMISHCTSYPTDQYVYGIGYGGLKYLQFSMTDAEWAQAVANNGGSWDYSK